jgi:hypothetical protein
LNRNEAKLTNFQQRQSQKVPNTRRQEKLRLQAVNTHDKKTCMRYVKVSKNEQLTMLIKKKINYLVNEKLQTNAKKIQNN